MPTARFNGDTCCGDLRQPAKPEALAHNAAGSEVPATANGGSFCRKSIAAERLSTRDPPPLCEVHVHYLRLS
ncbi:hypothetical protein JOB18_040841 [Solea senegalensis]|uniref:Uncharacterized protein n=1 Tax=Solea senegalensis TaxID=28829 RepID=A0AAV6QA53_SOLSE|nr:hypothetical protein JOB18_040841 [Solea senegalensis]